MLQTDGGILVTWREPEQPYPYSLQRPILADTPMTYPYPGNNPVAYPSPHTSQQAIVTSLLADMTPVPASKEVLATAIENFGHFFRELPFVDTTKGEPYREYYGCTNSQNAGSIINYIVTTQTAENIMIALTEYFDKREIKHTDWEEYDITDFLGYSWKISASYRPQNDPDACWFNSCL